MKRDALKPIKSSFMSHSKDAELIIRKLFIESRPHSDELKRLLVINTKDCLDLANENYKKIINEMSVSKLMDLQYVTLTPRLRLPEHEEVKSYIVLSFNDYYPTNTNAPEFRDSVISFDIICNTDCWEMGDYEIRPLKIAGYIDGILNECKLTGIGTLNFMGCKEVVFDNELAGYTLLYRAVHGSDDRIPA